MAEKFGYRACWSFPIHTAAAQFVGTLAIYWPQPRQATPRDQEFAATITQVAGIIIARHLDTELRGRTKRALREVQARLQSELDDSKLLQNISAEIAQGGNVDALYDKILDAAVSIMRSQYGSIQMYYPERGSQGELRLLASRGFSADNAVFPEWVGAEDAWMTSGHALRAGRRAIAEDVETCDFMGRAPIGQLFLATVFVPRRAPH